MNYWRPNSCILASLALCLLIGGAAYSQEDTAPADAEVLYDSEQAPDPLVEDINRDLNARRGQTESTAGPLGGAQTQPMINALRWIMSVCVVLALILVLYWAARRFGGRTPFLAGADLGSVMGRIYLDRQAALYFVETGGRVLVVGVTNGSVRLVSEFDAQSFDAEMAEQEFAGPSDAESFLSELEASRHAMRGATMENALTHEPVAAAPKPKPDRDMDSMKTELERMRRMLADEGSDR